MNIKNNSDSAWCLFVTFLRLGLTSFGGPVAHLGYFRNEFVVRQRWVSEQEYAGIVSLCQFLPGPASSQVGLIMGMLRAGHRGAFAAWLGFTLPSAIVLTLFAMGLTTFNANVTLGLIHGLKIAAVAIVAQAIWGMAKTLCNDFARCMIMLASAALVLLYPFFVGQLAAIILSGVIGFFVLRANLEKAQGGLTVRINTRLGTVYLAVFFVLLLGLPLLAEWVPMQSTEIFSSFYRAGSLVFGGGHVVLPLLQSEVVGSGYMSHETFLAGYGAAQAVPGPLFTFAAFLGASIDDGNLGWYGSLLCLVALFLPSFLLVAGVLPFWGKLQRSPGVQSTLAGINAGVVGLLLAILLDPIGVSAVTSLAELIWVLIAFSALMALKWPSWLIVLGCAIIGLVLQFF